MRRCACLVAGLLVGCQLAPDAPVASRQDGLAVLVVGSPDAGLGEIVSSCSSTALVAGRSEVRAESTLLPTLPSVTALSCTPGMSPVYVAGANPGGLATLSSPFWLLGGDGVDSLARGPVSGTLLVGHVGDRVDVQTTSDVSTLDAGTLALAWSSDETRFAAAGSTRVDVFTWNSATRAAALRNSIPLGVAPRHNAMVFGDFLPNGTFDLAVGTVDGRVLVFSEYGGAALVLTGEDLSFGTGLAVDTEYVASLDALIVGEPDSSRVVRMMGDAGRGGWSGALGDRFGAALTVLANRRLLIGAPGADAGAGAVYSEALVSNGALRGEAMECDVSRRCSLAHPNGCFVGDCLGGVACINQTPGCDDAGVCTFDGAGWECVFPLSSLDAGALLPDGGMQDGGPSSDAGNPTSDAGRDSGSEPPDAGLTDAGLTDAGTEFGDGGARTTRFVATGCAAAPPTLMAWGLLLFASRRLTNRR